MSDDSYLLDGNDRKKEKDGSRWFGRILKFIFIIIAFFLVIITVLANMGGSNDMLTEGVGETISRAFGGRPVTMRRLVHMGFFPSVSIDVEDVLIFDKPEDSFPIMRLDKFQAAMPFFNVATSTPRLTTLYLEGFETIRGVFLPATVRVDRIFIDHDVDEGIAKLRGNGKVGVHSWDFSVGLEITGSRGKYQYMLLDDADLIFNIADIHFSGVFSRRGASYYKFRDFKLEYADKKVSGDLVLSSLGQNLLKVKSNIKIQNDGTNFQTDLIIKFMPDRSADISGEVISDKLLFDDFIGDNSIFTILSRLREIAGYSEVDSEEPKTIVDVLFGKNIIDIEFDLDNVDVGGHVKDSLEFNITKDQSKIKIGSFLSQGNMVMPAVMLLHNQEDSKVIFVVQNGSLDIGFVKLWLDNLPKNILSKDIIDIECGIAEFLEVDNGLEVGSFVIDANSYKIGVKDKNINELDDFSNLHFIDISKENKINNIELPKGLYDFVQSSFNQSKDGSPCSGYIAMVNNKTSNEAIEKTSKPE